MKLTIPLRTARGLNSREHHFARARRVRAEREAVAWMLKDKTVPPLPVVVLLTRLSPGTRPMDDDGVQGAMKAIRDQIAQWLGVDDADPRVRFFYAQRRAPWGVEVVFS